MYNPNVVGVTFYFVVLITLYNGIKCRYFIYRIRNKGVIPDFVLITTEFLRNNRKLFPNEADFKK